MKEGPLSDRVAFINKHRDEILPLEKNPAVLDEALMHPTRENLNAILQTYETKVLTWKREHTLPESRKILLEASQPANYGILTSLMEHLRDDSRCGEITLLTDNVAGQQLEKTAGMTLVRTDKAPVMADITDGPYDAALIIDEPVNSPAPFLRESAKSVFQARRLLYFSPGVPTRSSVERAFPPSNPDSVDMFLTADEFTRRMACEVFGIRSDKVDVVGSPGIETILNSDANSLRLEGRDKLSIADGTITAAYLGFSSGDYRAKGGVPLINTSTYLNVAQGVIETAKRNPHKQYALVARTHPRARAVEPLPDISSDLPHNLQFINGDSVSYDDVVYAADLICCIASSTEAMFAHYRSRAVALCAFSGKGEAGEMTLADYGEKGIAIFEETERGTAVASPESLVDLLANAHPLEKSQTHSSRMAERLKEMLVS